MGFLFGGQQQRSQPVQRMPTSNDAVVRAARERTRRNVMDRTGRTSTVLTSDAASSGAGTQSYTNSLLGSA